MWIIALFTTIFIIIIVAEVLFNYIRNTSCAYKKIIDINEKYISRFKIRNFDKSHVYDNEIFYNQISCEDYLIYQLQFEKSEIEKEIFVYKQCLIDYDVYLDEIDKIDQFGKCFKFKFKWLNKELLKIEKYLFDKEKIAPPKKFNIVITLYCSKINGDVYRIKKEFFDSEKLMGLIERLKNKNGSFYNDREIWNSICRVERGRVSNKMRFAIYRRDGYKCKICGISDKFVSLEIDHIIPIAKGGKSVYSNLQTLCKRCNKIKGDSL